MQLKPIKPKNKNRKLIHREVLINKEAMVLSNKKTLVPRGAPSVPNNLSVNPQSTNHELHASPTSSFIAAAKGQLGPHCSSKVY
jgi:hypothetical protein